MSFVFKLSKQNHETDVEGIQKNVSERFQIRAADWFVKKHDLEKISFITLVMSLRSPTVTLGHSSPVKSLAGVSGSACVCVRAHVHVCVCHASRNQQELQINQVQIRVTSLTVSCGVNR